MSTLPIRVKTTFGDEQFSILHRQMTDYKQKGLFDAFRSRCLADAIKVSEYLTFFLEDKAMIHKYPMDDTDKEGWRISTELSDMVSILNYFGKKTV